VNCNIRAIGDEANSSSCGAGVERMNDRANAFGYTLGESSVNSVNPLKSVNTEWLAFDVIEFYAGLIDLGFDQHIGINLREAFFRHFASPFRRSRMKLFLFLMYRQGWISEQA
jgi:hypothetical protein